MRLHRFLLDQLLHESIIHVSDQDVLHQWSRVLRYTEGVQVALIDGKGTEVIGTLTALSPKQATLQVESRQTEAQPTEPALTLYFSPLKRELTELTFQKGTELGVSAFQPILCDRTIREGFNPERTARILKEATEQSGRLWLPTFQAPISFREALRVNTANTTFFATLEVGATNRLSSVPGDKALFIGPEGGWTKEEEQAAIQAGYTALRLSSHVLRAETACIAGVAILRA